MLETTTANIGGKTYTIGQLPAGQGRKIYFRIVKLCGPAVIKAVKGGNLSLAALKDESALALLADAADELLAQLSEADFELFVRTFAEHTLLGSTRLLDVIDTLAFAGHPGLLMVWLKECLRFNFSSFLADLGLTSPPA
jgi:hypothetical protein